MDTFGVHTHLITERSVVRAVQKIVLGHPEFFEALRAFAHTSYHSISYVVGNHDAGMLWAGPRKVFADSVGAEIRFYDVRYQFDGIHVEHGQQYEQFAQTDMQRPFLTRGFPEPVLNLPWGSLFVAVQLPKIKKDRPHIDKVRPGSVLIRWVLIHDIFWGLKTGLGILKFILDTVLLRSHYQIHQGMRATLGLLKEITLYPNYDKIAFKILETHEHINTVIFGHTHMIRYRQWREGKEYFNEGTWNETTNLELSDYGKQIRLTYAWIEYPQPDSVQGTVGRPLVKLKQWHGNWKSEMDVLV
jgi:UDP-2,3-diacylglucosamine pyrophosphatase LpxH